MRNTKKCFLTCADSVAPDKLAYPRSLILDLCCPLIRKIGLKSYQRTVQLSAKTTRMRWLILGSTVRISPKTHFRELRNISETVIERKSHLPPAITFFNILHVKMQGQTA